MMNGMAPGVTEDCTNHVPVETNHKVVLDGNQNSGNVPVSIEPTNSISVNRENVDCNQQNHSIIGIGTCSVGTGVNDVGVGTFGGCGGGNSSSTANGQMEHTSMLDTNASMNNVVNIKRDNGDSTKMDMAGGQALVAKEPDDEDR